ncbi:RNA recognition motif domain-containing protein [Paraburkholderia sp. SOS3]|jgi:hypothetical protein|uniref:RNA recognition motif domain-containing protein n=1 Tax=Paraburkholderia sp. SOS3 TaxID=1926494 RepID=UPI000947619F|nr:RNA-binding protein [Paraburkholderia sp. SOS3]APR39464.1 hypothetical protein BTO02_29800 [Paraburkholderia sp. SOS3]
MADMMIGNIEDGTSEEEIQALLSKYGFPVYDAIQHVPGVGSRPAVLLSFNGTEAAALRMLQPRIHNLFWKNRRLNVVVLQERSEE